MSLYVGQIAPLMRNRDHRTHSARALTNDPPPVDRFRRGGKCSPRTAGPLEHRSHERCLQCSEGTKLITEDHKSTLDAPAKRA